MGWQTVLEVREQGVMMNDDDAHVEQGEQTRSDVGVPGNEMYSVERHDLYGEHMEFWVPLQPALLNRFAEEQLKQLVQVRSIELLPGADWNCSPGWQVIQFWQPVF